MSEEKIYVKEIKFTDTYIQKSLSCPCPCPACLKMFFGQIARFRARARTRARARVEPFGHRNLRSYEHSVVQFFMELTELEVFKNGKPGKT